MWFFHPPFPLSLLPPLLASFPLPLPSLSSILFYELVTVYVVLTHMNYYEVIIMTILITATCLNRTAALFNYNLGINRVICH